MSSRSEFITIPRTAKQLGPIRLIRWRTNNNNNNNKKIQIYLRPGALKPSGTVVSVAGLVSTSLVTNQSRADDIVHLFFCFCFQGSKYKFWLQKQVRCCGLTLWLIPDCCCVPVDSRLVAPWLRLRNWRNTTPTDQRSTWRQKNKINKIYFYYKMIFFFEKRAGGFHKLYISNEFSIEYSKVSHHKSITEIGKEKIVVFFFFPVVGISRKDGKCRETDIVTSAWLDIKTQYIEMKFLQPKLWSIDFKK